MIETTNQQSIHSVGWPARSSSCTQPQPVLGRPRLVQETKRGQNEVKVGL